MRKTFIILIAALLLTGSVLPQEKPVTFKDAIGWKSVSSPVLSPEGNLLAYVCRSVDWGGNRYVSHIRLIDVQTGEDRLFTNGPAGESSPSFSPDGRTAAFLTARKNSSEEENPKQQVWTMPVSGGEAVKLTSAPEGVLEFVWGNNPGTIFYVTREEPDPGVKARREKQKKEKFDAIVKDAEKYRHEVWSVDMNTQKAQKVFDGEYGLNSIDLSPDGGRIAYTTNLTGVLDDGDKVDVWIYDINSREKRRLTSRFGSESSPHWTPDGKRILFQAPLGTGKLPTQTELFIVSADGGEPVNLTERLDRPVFGYALPPGANAAIAVVGDGFYTHLYEIDIDSGDRKLIAGGNVNAGDVTFAEQSGALAYTAYSGTQLTEIFCSANGSAGFKQVTDYSKQLSGFALARQDVISWESVDGRTIEGLLVRPAGSQPGGKMPLIVQIHGGPHGRDTDGLTAGVSHQALASLGYAVLKPNFRGSSGYDAAFDEANYKDFGGGDFHDIMAGVDMLIESGIADESRMGVMGGSYGGYMTNWIITQTGRFAGAVSMYGIWSLITDFSNSNIPTWERRYFDDYYWNALDLYIEHSPMKYVENVTTPALIMHGQDDPNTFLANSNEMYQALSQLGKTVEYVIYPREVHGIGREPNHILDKCNRIVDWFETHILKEPETAAMQTDVSDGDWRMTVQGITAQPQAADESRKYVIVVADFSHAGGGAASLKLDLARECALEFGEGRETGGVGLFADGIIIKTETVELSESPEYSIGIVFSVPADAVSGRVRIKGFPAVRITF